jgi:hypothetical protein
MTDLPSIELLCPKLGWCSNEVIKHTLKRTTQYARSLNLCGDMRKYFKVQYPAFNVSKRSESVAIDTVYSDTYAVDNGSKCAHIFIGCDSLVIDVDRRKTDKECINTLEDNIPIQGAMTKLISERATAEISNKIKDILRAYKIDDWQSEPHHPL